MNFLCDFNLLCILLCFLFQLFKAFFKFKIIYWNMLHSACQYGYLELVKYLVSLNKFDINQKDIFFYLFIILLLQLF